MEKENNKKQAIIYVFSGTGNTLKTATLYKSFLDGYDVAIHRITMKNGVFVPFPNPVNYELVGIGYPIHAFNAPQVVENFCKELPAVNQISTFIFKTSGEGLSINNYSSDRLIRIIKKKGYFVLSERHIVLPHNIMLRHPTELVQIEWAYAQSQTMLHCRAIVNGRNERLRTRHLAGWFVALLRIEWIYARVQGKFMRVEAKKCVKCLKCVKNCPLSNIKFDGVDKFIFGTNCAMCQSCVMSCPKDAINIGILNGCKLNGSYNLGEQKETAIKDRASAIQYLSNLRGFRRLLFYPHFIALDKEFELAGIAPIF